VRSLIDNAHINAQNILRENRPRLVHLANRLAVAETLEGPALEKAFSEPIPPDESEPGTPQTLQSPKAIGPNHHQPQGIPQPLA
jgi:hypothetical protein